MNPPTTCDVEASSWLDEGRRFAARGDLASAETWFKRAVLTCPIPAALNNLALVHLEHRHDPAEALSILAPNLDDSLPQPYAHAPAARCHARLANGIEVRRHLDAAVDDFETAAAPEPLADDRLMAIAEYAAIGPVAVRGLAIAPKTKKHRILPGAIRDEACSTS